MTIDGDYLGMSLRIEALDHENLAYFRHCAAHDFHLQRCAACDLLRYPPTTGCPWCGHPEAVWTPVAGQGTVHTYAEVHHAIQPAFRGHLPYLILIVELDAQRGQPGGTCVRIAGNLATPEGDLHRPSWSPGSASAGRVRIVFKDLAPGLALPLWTLDEAARQPAVPWRYPNSAVHADRSRGKMRWQTYADGHRETCHGDSASQDRPGWTSAHPFQDTESSSGDPVTAWCWRPKGTSCTSAPIGRRSEKLRPLSASTSLIAIDSWWTS